MERLPSASRAFPIRASSFRLRRRRSEKLAGADPLQLHGMPSISLRLRRSLDSLRSKSDEAIESSASSTSSTKSTMSAKTSKSMKKAGRRLKTLPGSIRRRASSALDKFQTENSSTLSFITEEEDPLPEVDHAFDLNVTLTSFTLQQDLDAALEHVFVPAIKHEDGNYPIQKLDFNGPFFLWFELSINCRRRIYKLLFIGTEKKISLSASQFTRAVFPDWCFLSPWDVLDDLEGPLGSCKAWRKEVMAYFWSQYHFHITLNEFTMKFTCPLSHGWVYPYFDLIQRLTIERDFTRLAGSHQKGAASLSFAISKKVTVMLNVLVAGLLRRNGMPMAELHFMARKYAGLRPADHRPDSLEPVIYVPTYVEETCAGISKLESILTRFRMSGFSQEFIKATLQTMFKNKTFYKEYEIPEESPWPSLSPNPTVNFFLLAALKFPPQQQLPEIEEQSGNKEDYNMPAMPLSNGREDPAPSKYPFSTTTPKSITSASLNEKSDDSSDFGPANLTSFQKPVEDIDPNSPSGLRDTVGKSSQSFNDRGVEHISNLDAVFPTSLQLTAERVIPRPSFELAAGIEKSSQVPHSHGVKSSSDLDVTPTSPGRAVVEIALDLPSGIQAVFQWRNQTSTHRGIQNLPSNVESAMTHPPSVLRSPSLRLVPSFDSSFVSDDMTYIETEDEKPTTSNSPNSTSIQYEGSLEGSHNNKQAENGLNLDVADRESLGTSLLVKSIVESSKNRLTIPALSGTNLALTTAKRSDPIGNFDRQIPTIFEVQSVGNGSSLKQLAQIAGSIGRPDNRHPAIRPTIGNGFASSSSSSHYILAEGPLTSLPSAQKSLDSPVTCDSSDHSPKASNLVDKFSNTTERLNAPDRSPKVNNLIEKFSNGSTPRSNIPKVNTSKLRTPRMNNPGGTTSTSRIPLPNRIKVPNFSPRNSSGERISQPLPKYSKSVEDLGKGSVKNRDLRTGRIPSRANTPEITKSYMITVGTSDEGASKPSPKVRKPAEQAVENSNLDGVSKADSARSRSNTPDSHQYPFRPTRNHLGGLSNPLPEPLPKPSEPAEQSTDSHVTTRSVNFISPTSEAKISKHTKIPLAISTNGGTTKPLPRLSGTKVKSPDSSDEFRERFPEFSPTFMSSNKTDEKNTLTRSISRSVSPVFEKEKYEAMLAKMDQMNESDEAFQRTMGALQALSDQDKQGEHDSRIPRSRVRSGPAKSNPNVTNNPRNGYGEDGEKSANRTFFSSFSFKRT